MFQNVWEIDGELPLEIVQAALSNSIMNDAHRLNDLLLNIVTANNIKLPQEVVSNSNQCIFRPTLEPVHGAARNETRELECSLAEFLSNLNRQENN